jgi:glycosyltransferase involved in cell wall biosynthesis
MTMKHPTVTAMVRVYNGEEHVGESLAAILSQTRPPDEVLVIDDGSTDGTPDALKRFGGDIRVVRQANSGYAGAFNRGFGEARGDYVANCDADDIWEPDKLERQTRALLDHPEIDFAFTGARFFGLHDGPRAPYPGAGLLESRAVARRIYRANCICTSSTLIRRSVVEQLGPFDDRAAPCEDYDYWLRVLAAGAVLFYDPRELVRYRTHAEQISKGLLRMHRREHMLHGRHSGLVADSRLVGEMLARDLSNIGRALSDEDRPREARAAFVSSLRHRPTPRVLGWVLVLSAPDRYRRPLADNLVSIKRALVSAPSR